MHAHALRSPKPKRPTKPKSTKTHTYPVCAIYTKFPKGDVEKDSTLHVNFDALPLGKLKMMATSMLDLPVDTTDWSVVQQPLKDHFRTIIGSGQYKSIDSDSATFIIELIVPTRAIEDVTNIIINHLSEFGIPAKAFR